MKHGNFAVVMLLGCSLFCLPNCGKHESSAGTAGAAGGALVGNALTGGRSKSTGTLVGALVGNLIGREIGREADKQEKEREEDTQRIKLARRERVAKIKEENRVLKESMLKWCKTCNHRIRILRAQRCPDCGDRLIQEKFCRCCTRTFVAQSDYRYCPYCPKRVLLSSR